MGALGSARGRDTAGGWLSCCVPECCARCDHPCGCLPAGSKESLFSCTLTASEEAMAVLEEVVLYAFQQCVYYVSKVHGRALLLHSGSSWDEVGLKLVPVALLEAFWGADGGNRDKLHFSREQWLQVLQRPSCTPLRSLLLRSHRNPTTIQAPSFPRLRTPASCHCFKGQG